MVHRDAQKLGRALLTLAPPQPPFASGRSGLSTRFSRIQNPTGIWRHSAPISGALGAQPRLANEAYMPLADTLQSSTIGSADATAPKADPTDRSETESHRGRRARIPWAGRPLSGAPKRRVRLRPNIHQSGRERDHQPDGGSALADRGRAGDTAESACETDGVLDC